jgi:iron complex transport system ATP-binding protein
MLIADKISYKIKDRTILSEISFEANKGEFLAILGPNGAGKSSLLRILSGELKNNIGVAKIDGQKVSAIKPKELAFKRAVLSQNISLTLPFSVSEVVMMGRYPYFSAVPSADDVRIVEECLEMTGMLHFKERNYLTLSGGEKQRVHLARVLAQLADKPEEKNNQNPKILFLDEPVNGLDLKYQQQVMTIARAWKGTNNVVVAVLHDLNLAAHFSDRILLLNKGKQEELGTPDNVLTAENIKRVYDVDVKIFGDQKDERLYIAPVSPESNEGFNKFIIV